MPEENGEIRDDILIANHYEVVNIGKTLDVDSWEVFVSRIFDITAAQYQIDQGRTKPGRVELSFTGEEGANYKKLAMNLTEA